MVMTGSQYNGNGELTRDILRKEIKLGLAEQTISFRTELDKRFEPVNEHIARVDRGELTFAQKAAILDVIGKDRDDSVIRRNSKIPIIALLVSVVSLAAMITFTLAQGGVFA